MNYSGEKNQWGNLVSCTISSSSDLVTRQKYVSLVESVRENGGDVKFVIVFFTNSLLLSSLFPKNILKSSLIRRT